MFQLGLAKNRPLQKFEMTYLFFDAAFLGILAHNRRVNGEVGGSLVLEAVSYVNLGPGPPREEGICAGPQE